MILMNNAMLNKLAQYIGPYGVGNTSTLDIYSGSIPTITNSTVWAASTYASQVLVRFSLTSGSTGSSVGVVRLPAVSQVNATATGTAGWFAWYNGTSCITGTISDVGPNIAPMYIDSINLVAGTPVNVIQVGIRFSFS